jgi:protein involved in polysaccharide export with SLBB domain
MSLISKKNNIPIQVLLGLVLLLAIQPACTHQVRPSGQHPDSYSLKPWSLATAGVYQAVVAGDLNGDQHPDIAGGSSVPGTVAIWYGNGQGGWSSPFMLPTKGDVRSIALGDFDTDGRPDLAVSMLGDNPGIQVWLNRGRKGWEKGPSPAESEKFHGIRVDDINGDGNPDLISAAAGVDGPGGIRVWFGDGQGDWLTDVGPTVRGEYNDVAVADFNEDGHLDICGSSIGPHAALRVWLGDGKGGWSDLSPLEMGNFYALTVGDLNRDGHMDLFSGTYRHGIRIYLGDGRGGFFKVSSPVNKKNFWKVLTGDVDSDGVQELVASSLDSQGIWVWKYKNGDLSPVPDFYGSSGTYYDMALTDLDSDGRQDLLTASDGQGVRIWASQTQIRSLAAVTFGTATVVLPDKGKEAFPLDPKENEVFVTMEGRPQYKIGPEDVLDISLWEGIEEKKYEVQVRPDGKISFTFFQDIYVSGLTVSELDDLLTRKLGRFIRQPRVAVRVKEYNSKFVSLLGAISVTGGTIVGPETPRGARTGPGNYALRGKTTVLQVLARAGGPTEKANIREITVRRKTGQATLVNLNKTITQGDLTQNPVLDNEDTVVVPVLGEDKKNRVFVFGEVNNPGVIPTRGDLTVVEALALAGGFKQRAVLGDARILRGDMTRPEVIACDIDRILNKGDMSQNVKLRNGDMLYVPKNAIGRVSDFLREIAPILGFITYPAQVYRSYEGSAPFD